MMSRAGVLVLVRVMALVLALFLEACIAKNEGQQCTSSCGNIHNISYPFRLKGDSPECGNHKFELDCENNRTTLSLYSGKYYVQNISYDYDHGAMRLVDASLDNDSCSFPRYSLTGENFSIWDPYHMYGYQEAIAFMNCTKAVNSSFYVDATSCIPNSSSPENYFYVLYGGPFRISDILEECSVQALFPADLHSDISNLSISDIHHHLLKGFVLGYCGSEYCRHGFIEIILETIQFQNFWKDLKFYLFNTDGYYKMLGATRSDHYHTIGRFASLIIKGFVLERTPLGILFLVALLIWKFRQRHLSGDGIIEEFLQSQNNLMPIRYSYSEIKKMTKGFKEKLGQGGYGYVYKGKSRSGHHLAIKVLGTSKGNGQDFTNEVATIGRIHHVNVVRLTGFCVEGSKRALVYEFMVNGSLDKFIFHKGEKINLLSWDKIYEIGLRVAQGIEYLHRGCDKQILHFDIKPHNILLDENFIPKISDFGLAKLYPVDDSIVSLTDARGTPGYIAPELFYKNIGGISYKADVYSFGMLLMEMVGKRKQENALALEEHLSHSTQIYFSSWVYDRMSQGEDIDVGDANEDEKKIVRKMIIIALWCTQLKPVDRPSMSKVLEMLKGEVELLQLPPKPLLYPQEMSVMNHAENNSRGTLISSYNDIGTITLDVR